ncbi:hypothetical protein TNCV_5077091 [Trichonephila clavipes]|uniref:Uncharacterized protein n=1 Tax=Trichonephila clavipes TaxID=2585209 RepID=A0A8X6S1J3_TRICX|nr:hypothetical protein TNCV_5077091 [Trichonephila clavipes]
MYAFMFIVKCLNCFKRDVVVANAADRQCQIETHEIHHAKGLDCMRVVSRSFEHYAATSRIVPESGLVGVHDTFPHGQYENVWNSTDCLHEDHYCGFPGRCIIETRIDSSVPNENTECSNASTASFQMSSGSTCSIIMDVYVSGVAEENTRRIRYSHTVPEASVMVWQLLGAVVPSTSFAGIAQDQTLEWLPHRLRHPILKRSSQFLVFLILSGVAVPANSFACVRRRKKATPRHFPNRLINPWAGLFHPSKSF